MALYEEGVLDPRFGLVVNHDLAEYYIATNADVSSIEVDWVGEEDPYVNPMGSKGIGEVGIVGIAARRSPTPCTTPPASECETCRSPSTSSCNPD